MQNDPLPRAFRFAGCALPVEPLFAAIATGQSLHPDPMGSDNDDFGLEDGEGDEDDGVATFVRSSGDFARLNSAQQVCPL